MPGARLMCDVLQLVELVDAGTAFEVDQLQFDFLAMDPDVVVDKIDLGFPAVREVTVPRASASGTVDTTALYSSRGVTISCSLDPAQPSQSLGIATQLAGLMDPARRMYLYIRTVDDPQTWRILMRASAMSSPLQRTLAPQLSWVAPDGVLETADPQIAVSQPAGAETGIALPAALPATFGTGSPPGGSVIDIPGTVPVWPVIYIYGPILDPVITNQSTGQQMQLTANGGLNVPAGQNVAVDMRNHTILANSDPTISRLGYADWTVSSWWQLQPGANVLTLTAVVPQSTPPMQIVYRPAKL